MAYLIRNTDTGVVSGVSKEHHAALLSRKGYEDASADVDAEPSEIDATDAARELAEAEGIDLSQIEGTGADGRITKGDVEAAVAA